MRRMPSPGLRAVWHQPYLRQNIIGMDKTGITWSSKGSRGRSHSPCCRSLTDCPWPWAAPPWCIPFRSIPPAQTRGHPLLKGNYSGHWYELHCHYSKVPPFASRACIKGGNISGSFTLLTEQQPMAESICKTQRMKMYFIVQTSTVNT